MHVLHNKNIIHSCNMHGVDQRRHIVSTVQRTPYCVGNLPLDLINLRKMTRTSRTAEMLPLVFRTAAPPAVGQIPQYSLADAMTRVGPTATAKVSTRRV